ncbi:MAG: polysaccharide deacetylase family protein [Opitutaceae bacterium]
MPLSKNIICTLLLALTSPFMAGGATPSVSFGDKGIIIANGVDAPLTLTYPAIMNEARKEAKVAAATFTPTTATVTYEGGGQLTLQLGNGEVVFNLSGLPAGIKHLHSAMNIGPEYGGAGQWKVGTGAATLFPKEKPASPFLHKGGSTDFSLFGPTGVQTVFTVPAYSYQQINDNREWLADIFQWHVMIPVIEGASGVSMTIVPAAGTAAATPPAPVAAAPAPVSLKAAMQPAELDATFTGTRVLKWKDGKRAVFMIEFDDSAASHLTNAIPELVKRGIPGTFYINPGNGPYKSRQAEWEKAANLPGIELANHTYTHIGGLTVEAFETEVVKCNEVLNALYPDRKQPRLISFGRPGVPKEKWGITEAQIKDVLAKNHMIERPQFIGPPFQLKTVAEMNKWVDTAIETGDMKHLVFHGVGGDWLITPLDYFAAVLDKLDANRDQLWLTTPLSWHQYLTERKTAVARELSSDKALIRIALTSEADPAFYDFPLSLATRVPADWKNVLVQQGKSSQTVPSTNGLVRYEAIPGAGEITLKPASKS